MICVGCELEITCGYYMRTLTGNRAEATLEKVVRGPYCNSCWASRYREKCPTFYVALDEMADLNDETVADAEEISHADRPNHETRD